MGILDLRDLLLLALSIDYLLFIYYSVSFSFAFAACKAWSGIVEHRGCNGWKLFCDPIALGSTYFLILSLLVV